MDLYNFGKGEIPAHIHPKGGGWVANTAEVDEDCHIGPYAMVYDNAKVKNDSKVDGYAKVYGNSVISDTAKIYGDAQVYDNAQIMKNARISGKARVYGKAKIYDHAQVYDNAQVYDHAILRNFSEVYENARVYGNALLIDQNRIYNDCAVTKQPFVVTGAISNIGGPTQHVTITDNHVAVGCVVLPPKLWKEHGVSVFSYFSRYFTDTVPNEDKAKSWIDIILYVANFHGCVDREEDIEKIKKSNVINRILMGETQDRNINRGSM